MTQSPILFVRLLAIAWCVAYPLATAGCARHKTDAALAAPAPAPEPRLPVALRVTNSNWSDVRIYVVRGAMWLRLGTVTTNSTVDFTIPVDYLSGAGAVTLGGAQRALAPLAPLTARTAGATRPAGSPWTSARHNAGEERVVERHDHGDPAAVSSGSPRSTAAAVASRGAGLRRATRCAGRA